ncbi:MAG: tetratricopeptide repeat protein [Candidatus Obscuribacterales bacterium]|nr:tetratricopeptide repeat protein [Candidatus Obscuribacterales bacterium]
MKRADELQQFANMCEEKGDYVKAARLHTKALAAKERVSEKDDPELISYLYNSAMINCAIDRKQEAETLFNRLLELLLAYYPEEHLDVKEIRQILLDLYVDEEVSALPLAVTA